MFWTVTSGRRVGSLLAFLLFALAWSGVHAANSRVALLIGNGDYALATLGLRNPANDVRDLGELLDTRLGFSVTRVVNASSGELHAALSVFADRARGAEIALVFFAGHGMQIAGENHLIGIEFPELTLPAILSHSLTLGTIRAALAEAAPRTALVILDSCRQIPDTQGVSTAPGLAPPMRGQPGYLIAYSTDPGNLAEDGRGENSPFTAALMEHLPTPGLDLRLLFGRIRQDVILETGGAQVPWVEESLVHPVALLPGESGPGPSEADEIALWRAAETEGTAVFYTRYLTEHSDGLFAELARQRLERLEDGLATSVASSSGQEGTPSETDAAVIAAAEAKAEAGRLAEALKVIGYLPEVGESASRVQMRSALRAYFALAGSTVAVPIAAEEHLARIYAEAARTLVLVGAHLAQRIRVDVATLAGIETMERLSRNDLAEMRHIAGGRADRIPLLAAAEADVARLAQLRRNALVRLDQSREYYRLQLGIASRSFLEELSAVPSRGTGFTIGRDGTGHGLRLAEDARRFVTHVQLVADPERRNTMAWLADFLPR